MEGRPLDLSSSADDIEGATWPIFVSRLNVFEGGLAELMTEGASFCIPLEVTWYGERAQDYGGPRKEFLTMMCRSIRENLFVHSSEDGGYVLIKRAFHETRNHYFGAGIALGQFTGHATSRFLVWSLSTM